MPSSASVVLIALVVVCSTVLMPIDQSPRKNWQRTSFDSWPLGVASVLIVWHELLRTQGRLKDSIHFFVIGTLGSHSETGRMELE